MSLGNKLMMAAGAATPLVLSPTVNVTCDDLNNGYAGYLSPTLGSAFGYGGEKGTITGNLHMANGGQLHGYYYDAFDGVIRVYISGTKEPSGILFKEDSFDHPAAMPINYNYIGLEAYNISPPSFLAQYMTISLGIYGGYVT